jgi:hypothetical protein
VQADLQKFDTDFGLPDPPRFDIIQPAGPVPPFDPTDPDMAGWAEETSLDVQWAHSIAPGANLLLVETPVSETEGVQGFPEIVTAENFVINHHLGDVISQSFGATENTFPSVPALLQLRSAIRNAFAHHVTMLGASGDEGATGFKLNLTDLYTHRVNSRGGVPGCPQLRPGQRPGHRGRRQAGTRTRAPLGGPIPVPSPDRYPLGPGDPAQGWLGQAVHPPRGGRRAGGRRR